MWSEAETFSLGDLERTHCNDREGRCNGRHHRIGAAMTALGRLYQVLPSLLDKLLYSVRVPLCVLEI